MSNLLNMKIMHAAFFCPTPEGWWGLPIFGEGEPGTGKTHAIQAAARRVSLPFERLSPAERGEGQFGVVPVPMSDGYLHYPPPVWAQKFANGGIIFLDEITTAPPALQAPLLGVVQLRTLGSFVFGPRVRIIAAGNSVADAAGGWDLAPALANRFGHFDFEGFSPNEWVTAMLGGFANTEDMAPISAEVEESRVMSAWPSAIATARGIVGSFIKAKPDLLHKRPSSSSNNASRAWPSRRSVEYATYALAAARVHGLSEIDTDTFMAGFVGLPWVQEFATYRINMDLPDPADLLDGKVTFKHEARRLDRTMAVLSSVAALVIPEKAEKRDARAEAAWKLIASIMKDAADVVIPAATAMRRAQPPIFGTKFKSWQAVGAFLYPIFQEAGING